MALEARQVMSWFAEASEAVPSGYARIKGDERLGPDDLIWDYMHKRFLRNDSDEWTDRSPIFAEDVIYAVRSIKPIPVPGQSSRGYKLKR